MFHYSIKPISQSNILAQTLIERKQTNRNNRPPFRSNSHPLAHNMSKAHTTYSTRLTQQTCNKSLLNIKMSLLHSHILYDKYISPSDVLCDGISVGFIEIAIVDGAQPEQHQSHVDIILLSPATYCVCLYSRVISQTLWYARQRFLCVYLANEITRSPSRQVPRV